MPYIGKATALERQGKDLGAAGKAFCEAGRLAVMVGDEEFAGQLIRRGVSLAKNEEGLKVCVAFAYDEEIRDEIVEKIGLVGVGVGVGGGGGGKAQGGQGGGLGGGGGNLFGRKVEKQEDPSENTLSIIKDTAEQLSDSQGK